MKNKYSDLIEKTFEFPTEEFTTNSNGELLFKNISLMDLVKKHGTPVQFSFLPKISELMNYDVSDIVGDIEIDLDIDIDFVIDEALKYNKIYESSIFIDRKILQEALK